MKRHFVIESDTDMYHVFVREVKQAYTAEGIEFTCPADAEILALESPSPKFYGKLDALLVTRGRIENAEPITPEPKEVICISTGTATPSTN